MPEARVRRCVVTLAATADPIPGRVSRRGLRPARPGRRPGVLFIKERNGMRLCLDRPAHRAAGSARQRRSRRTAASSWMVMVSALASLIASEAVGKEPGKALAKSTPTYTRDVAPLLRQRRVARSREGTSFGERLFRALYPPMRAQ